MTTVKTSRSTAKQVEFNRTENISFMSHKIWLEAQRSFLSFSLHSFCAKCNAHGINYNRQGSRATFSTLCPTQNDNDRSEFRKVALVLCLVDDDDNDGRRRKPNDTKCATGVWICHERSSEWMRHECKCIETNERKCDAITTERHFHSANDDAMQKKRTSLRFSWR